MKLSNEAKVGALVLTTGILAVVFAWIIGIQNPFKQTVQFYVTYNFAGGIERGSPVRVSGIRVGQVEGIEFFVPEAGQAIAIQEPGSAQSSPEQKIIPVRLRVSVDQRAARGVREDSRAYINLAGVIGDRYIEITPGSQEKEAIEPGETLVGVDPPRLDQLLSQGFNVAEKIAAFIDENKGDITQSIELLYKLSENLNSTLTQIDKSNLFNSDFSSLISNLIDVTGDVKSMTTKVHTPEGKRTLELLYELLWRLEPMDSKQVRTFLQQEGVKVQMF
jgi:phospholipid/cholesterol/gamma-HCH transport system substrate-binding protein